MPQQNFLATLEALFIGRPTICGLCGRLDEKYRDESPADLWRAVHMPQHYGKTELLDPPGLFGSTSAHRVEMLQRLGGWNPRFKTNYEDFDLTVRIRQAGGRTLYSPACQLWHLRRDTLESVLRGCWNWTFHPGDTIGDFDSDEIWAQRRLPWIWDTYRGGRVVDGPYPQIAGITCLMPWSTIIRDLHEIYKRRGMAFDLDGIIPLARRLLPACGVGPEAVVGMTSWLHDLVSSLAPLPGPAEPWQDWLLERIVSEGTKRI